MILSSLPKVGDCGRAEVAEWQTRRSQKPMRATSCGFDSRSRHQATLPAATPAATTATAQEPPPPNPLEEPELGGENEIALEMFAFIDCRLFATSAPWNAPGPTYQLLPVLVSMPSNAFAHIVTQPNTIA